MLRSLTRHPVSITGAVIAVIAFANLVFLVAADLITSRDNPYVGILAYIVVPGILIFGVVLVVLGVILDHRRKRKGNDEIPRYPRLDFNQPRTRAMFLVTLLASSLFILASVLGSYQAYHYTDSDEFCGTACHSVMHPEYTTYLKSPHSRVGCVECHIGSGATWYVKSKMSGARQLYAVFAKTYSTPIQSPVHNLRPAQETCEQCHWPGKFWGAQMKVFNHFGYDEANTPRETRMLIKTGGGSPRLGLAAGIHWHMNIGNEVTYVATDPKRQKIPWVRVRDKATGKITDYSVEGEEAIPSERLATMERRTMDCVDCHNRPTHIFVPPDRAVDDGLLSSRIDRSLPFIKAKAVEVLTKEYPSTAAAIPAIAKDLDAYYRTDYPDIHRAKQASLQRSIAAVQEIFRTNIFPEMKVDWRTHPDNRGHLYSSGCFRCHDGLHKSADGKVISKDCSICHTVLEQKEGTTLMVQTPDAGFVHPIDIGDLKDATCNDCHSGASM